MSNALGEVATPLTTSATAEMNTVGLGALVYGLIESSNLGFRHPAVLATLIGGTLALFLMVEARVRNPMVPLSLFLSKNFSGANLLTFLL